MIISGTITKKMIPQLLPLYNQMLFPKYVIAIRGCAISGGLYAESDTVVNNLEEFLHIDKKVFGWGLANEVIKGVIYFVSRLILTTGTNS